jgi:hypothetical protein
MHGFCILGEKLLGVSALCEFASQGAKNTPESEHVTLIFSRKILNLRRTSAASKPVQNILHHDVLDLYSKRKWHLVVSQLRPNRNSVFPSSCFPDTSQILSDVSSNSRTASHNRCYTLSGRPSWVYSLDMF